MDDGLRYWAFLSYSHRDDKSARWLHRALETYRVPSRLVGSETGAGAAPPQFKPIFRDRSDLAADPDLQDAVKLVLSRSAFLIVVCSPAAARSPWVESEIIQFKRLHGEARVLPVIVAGEPHASDIPGREAEECFPKSLRYHLDGGEVGTTPAHPVAADLRPERDGRRVALLKLLAGMLRADLDDLLRRDVQRRQGRLVAITSMSVVATLIMGALTAEAISARNEAQAQRAQALAQRAQAEGLIEFMLSDLSKRLEPAGQLDALDAVGQRAMAYYAVQNNHDLDADSLGRRARVLHMVGDLREKRGDMGEASELFQEAATSTAELLARAPNDPRRIYDHAQSVYWVGHLAEDRGQLDEAQAQFEAYKQLADRLAAASPGKDEWRDEAVDANYDLGVVLLERHDADRATAAFAAAFPAFHARALARASDRESQFELGQVDAFLADADTARGRLDAALVRRMTERSIYAAMLVRAPNDNAAAYSLAVNRAKVASIMLAQQRLVPALAEARRATSEIDRLIAAEPDAVAFRETGAASYTLLGRILLHQHALADATAAAERALSLAVALTRKDPTLAEWQGRLLGGARVLQFEIAAEQAHGAPAQRHELAPAVAEAARLAKLAAGHPHDRNLAQVAAEAELLAGDYQVSMARADQARAWWTQALQTLSRARADGPDPLDQDSQTIMLKVQSRLAS